MKSESGLHTGRAKRLKKESDHSSLVGCIFNKRRECRHEASLAWLPEEAISAPISQDLKNLYRDPNWAHSYILLH